MVSMFWLMLMMQFGSFVGNVRQEYEKVLNDVIKNCTFKENFSSNQTKEVINYIKKKYGDELEFLWEKYDDNAVWRNKENQKWYGIVLTVSESKFDISSDRIVEVVNVRYDKDEISNIIDNETIFPAYHMNKKSWISIILDDRLETKKILELIDNSYELNIKKNSKNKK